MKYHKFRDLLSKYPWLRIIFCYYAKQFSSKDIGHLLEIEGWRWREFARNQLKFIAFRPGPTELLDFLKVVDGRAGVFVEDRWVGREEGRMPVSAKEVSLGTRAEFWSVIACDSESVLVSTTRMSKESNQSGHTIELIKTLATEKPNALITEVVGHCVVIIGTKVEVSVEIYPLAMTAADCLKRYNSFYQACAA